MGEGGIVDAVHIAAVEEAALQRGKVVVDEAAHSGKTFVLLVFSLGVGAQGESGFGGICFRCIERSAGMGRAATKGIDAQVAHRRGEQCLLPCCAFALAIATTLPQSGKGFVEGIFGLGLAPQQLGGDVPQSSTDAQKGGCESAFGRRRDRGGRLGVAHGRGEMERKKAGRSYPSMDNTQRGRFCNNVRTLFLEKNDCRPYGLLIIRQ